MLILGEQTQMSAARMGWVFSSRSGGYLCGALLGGSLFDHFKTNRLLVASLVCCAAATVLIPYQTDYYRLAACVVAQGFAMGFADTGGNVALLRVWASSPKNVEPYMQAMHAAFGCGAFIAPLVIGRLMETRENDIKLSFVVMALAFVPICIVLMLLQSPDVPLGDDARSSAAAAAAAATHDTSTGLSSPPVDADTDRFIIGGDDNDDVGGSDEGGDDATSRHLQTKVVGAASAGSGADVRRSLTSRERWIVLLVALFLCLYVGAEVTAGGYVYTYAVKSGLSHEHEAYYLNSTFWGTLTLGRLLSIPLSMRASPESMLFANNIGCLAAVAAIVANTDSAQWLWIGTAAYGLFMASSFPTTLLLAETCT
jgi:fucose permease